MLFWGVPLTGENVPSGGGDRPDNSLPPWLPATGPGGGGLPPTGPGGGGAPPILSLPIVLPPAGFPLPPTTPINRPDQGLPAPPDSDGGWMIVYTPGGGWQFIKAGDLLEAIKAHRPQPK